MLSLRRQHSVGTRECSFLRPCHFLWEKETAGKRFKVNVGLVSSMECKFGLHTVRVIKALFSGIPQSNLHLVNGDINNGCRLATNISVV